MVEEIAVMLMRSSVWRRREGHSTCEARETGTTLPAVVVPSNNICYKGPEESCKNGFACRRVDTLLNFRAPCYFR
jgi:hypothetical protein